MISATPIVSAFVGVMVSVYIKM